MSPHNPLKRAIFLDRDGTINKEVDHLSNPEEFELLAGAAETIAYWNSHGWVVVLVTNQAGIGRGMYTARELDAIHAKMNACLAERGARLDAIYFCPHHPDDQCECRKPKTLLFERAAKDLGIDLRRSYLIGDKRSDIIPAFQLGAKAILVKTGYGEKESHQLGDPEAQSIQVVSDLSAARAIVDENS